MIVYAVLAKARVNPSYVIDIPDHRTITRRVNIVSMYSHDSKNDYMQPFIMIVLSLINPIRPSFFLHICFSFDNF